MKIISTVEVQARFDTVLAESQRAPGLIRDHERLRAGAVQAFLELRSEVAIEASAAGLTEERLTKLLGED